MEKLTNVTQEQWFNFWVEEAIEAGFILEYTPENKIPPFTLFNGLSYQYFEEDKPKVIKKDTLLRPTSYTPDGIIMWNPKVKDILFNDLFEKGDAYFKAQWNDNTWFTIVDVKAPTGVNRSADLPFTFTRKWLWQRFSLFITKVMIVPPKPKDTGYLFKDIWAPARYFMTDKLTKERSIHFRTITVEQFKIKYKL